MLRNAKDIELPVISQLEDPRKFEAELKEKEKNLKKEINKIEERLKKPYGIILALWGLCVIVILVFSILVFIEEFEYITVPVILLAIDFLCISFVSNYIKGKTSKRIQLENEIKEIREIDEESIKMYNECNERYIQEEGNYPIENIVNIVGQKYQKCIDLDYMAYYIKGKNALQKKEIFDKETKKKEILEQIKKDREKKFKRITEERSAIGKEKYLAIVNKWLSSAKTLQKVSGNIKDIADCNDHYSAPRKDWAIIGGAASALGGSGLGVMAAQNAISQNDAAKKYEEKLKEKANIQREVASEIESFARMAIYDPEIYKKKFDKILVDDQNIKDKFDMLKCDVEMYDKVDDAIAIHKWLECRKGIDIFLKISLKTSPFIFSKPAILDGVLKLSLYNKNDVLLGCEYYIAPGYGSYNYKDAGFQGEINTRVHIPLDDIENINTKELKCVIEPDKLWLIEKNDLIFKIDNAKIQKEFDEYKKTYSKASRTAIISM